MADDARLLDALAGIRERGAIGESSLAAAVAHADHFTALIPAAAGHLADLGSGGGLPGLVIAYRLAELQVVLIERRESRADLLRRAASALELTARVEVLTADTRAVAAVRGKAFDVVTSRSFAAPTVTATHAAALLRCPGGVVLISEPPSWTPDRWPAATLAALRLHDDGIHDGVRRLVSR